MSISAISNHVAATIAPAQRAAPDGDSPAVEAAETAATKQAEKQNGGFEPKAQQAVSSGRVNVVA